MALRHITEAEAKRRLLTYYFQREAFEVGVNFTKLWVVTRDFCQKRDEGADTASVCPEVIFDLVSPWLAQKLVTPLDVNKIKRQERRMHNHVGKHRLHGDFTSLLKAHQLQRQAQLLRGVLGTMSSFVNEFGESKNFDFNIERRKKKTRKINIPENLFFGKSMICAEHKTYKAAGSVKRDGGCIFDTNGVNMVHAFVPYLKTSNLNSYLTECSGRRYVGKGSGGKGKGKGKGKGIDCTIQ